MFLIPLLEGTFWRENMFTHNLIVFIIPQTLEGKYFKRVN